MRAVAACAALAFSLTLQPTLAADPKVDAAVKTFNAVAADAGKLKIFCDMLKVMDAAGDSPSPADNARIDGFMKQLGPDFLAGWNLGDNVDENSADGKAWNDALDELAGKCPD
jgi:hypothetical protein